MDRPAHIRLEQLNLRLAGHGEAEAAALMRELPGALAREVAAPGRRAPVRLAERVAAEVVRQARRAARTEGDGR